MLAYFPETYPDELLYSVLARYHRHVSPGGAKQNLEDLFGSRSIRAAVGLQQGLGALSARIPPGRGLTAERLARGFTLFPYLTAFQPLGVAQAVLSALTNGGTADWVHVRLGLAASMVRAPSALRYCPACRAEMPATRGELWWRRAHQLPGVLVCPDHGAALADSRVVRGFGGQHDFVAADEETCPTGRATPAWADDPRKMALLSDIAYASVALLETPPAPDGFAELAEHYRQALAAHGFGKGNHRIAQERLAPAFNAIFGPIFGILPAVDPAATGDDWLVAMTRKHRKAFHPLRHILLRLFLDATPVKAPTAPFGDGPWPCRNPLAGHRGRRLIRHVETHREGGEIIGRFACSCGYVYSLAAGDNRKPRILDLGPLFRDGLRRLVAEGAGLRAAARALHVDPGTVQRHAERMGLVVGWKSLRERPCRSRQAGAVRRKIWEDSRIAHPDCSRRQLALLLPAEHAWLRRFDRDWLEATLPPCRSIGRHVPRVDWGAVDACLADLLSEASDAILHLDPPVRATRAELERRLGQPGWIGRRLAKLPACAAVLAQVTESLDHFRLRRIQWAVAELQRQGVSIRAWRIKRLAGLPTRIAPAIETALAEVASANSSIRENSKTCR
jgi:hypothetical protein